MAELKLPFEIGDHVMHWVYGPGEIIQLDEKTLSGHADQYYVVKIRELTVWVPVKEAGESCLRFPTTAKDFNKFIDILSTSNELLPTDRFERRNYLNSQMKSKSLEAVCKVIRDLTFYKHNNKMNDHDNNILNSARNVLIYEWSISLDLTKEQAEEEMDSLIDNSANNVGKP